jgi:hypothetical protein
MKEHRSFCKSQIMIGAMVLVIVSLLNINAVAGEIGHYMPGSWSPRDLLAAPDGTLAIAPYISFYKAECARTGSGDKVSNSTGLDVNADSWIFTPNISYSPHTKLLGADWSMVIVPAYGEAGASARISAESLNIPLFDNQGTGLGDLYVIPANLTWHISPKLDLSMQYAFWAPIGKYDSDSSNNVGLGYWSHDFRFTASYYPLGNPGILISSSTLYEINSCKSGFDLRPAPHLSEELGFSMAFSERFIWGLLLGGIWEVGDATGKDASEDGHDRMFNAGGEVSYWFMPGKVGAVMRVLKEFNARDRFEGETFIAGVNYLY